MSLVDRCGGCDDLITLCRCERSPLYEPPHRPAFNPAARGFHAVYRDNDRNWCPGCGREHWHVGRITAECAFCGTALPLQEASHRGSSATVVGFSTRPGVGPLE